MKQFHPSIPCDPSCHTSDREGYAICATAVHYTAGGSMASSIAWSKNAESDASWHFIIDRDGNCSQQVPLDRAAWHLGKATWDYKGTPTANPNRWTIGIELCNWGLLAGDPSQGFTVDVGGGQHAPYKGPTPVHGTLSYKSPGGPVFAGYWEPFPELQLARLEWLLTELRRGGYATAGSNLLGHNEAATPPGRKQDLGPLFPWLRFGRSPAALRVNTIMGIESEMMAANDAR